MRLHHLRLFDKLIFLHIHMKVVHMSYLERRHYRLLDAIDVYGQLSAAARSVGLTQSAASHQIREAERRLGIQLCVREGRTITLTPTARRLARTARVSEATLQAAEAQAIWLNRGALRKLRLAVGVYDHLGWLPSIMFQLQQSEPKFDIEVVRCGLGADVDLVNRRIADIAIVPSETAHGDLPMLEVFSDPLVAICSPTLSWSVPVTAEVVATNDYLTYGELPERGFEYEVFFRPVGIFPASIRRFESVAAIIHLVASNFGVSILPRWSLANSSQVLIRQLEPTPAKLSWSVCFRSDTSEDQYDEIVRFAAALVSSQTQVRYE